MKTKKIPVLNRKPTLYVKVKDEYKNSKGDMIPASMMSEQNILKDCVSNLLVNHALEYNKALESLKYYTFSILAQYRRRMAMLNNTDEASGGITVTSYDGTKKVESYWHDFTDYGEGLKQAKNLMGQVISEGSQDLNDVLRKIFLDAFALNRGQVSVTKILNLCNYQVDDPRWKQAVDIIRSDSNLRTRKEYVRFQAREKGNEWKTIYLDISKIPVDLEKV